MAIQDLNNKIVVAANFLKSRQNPKDAGWGLNIEDIYQTSNIVNTTEALFSINRGGGIGDKADKIVRFYKYAIRTHPIERGDRIRYYIYALWGMLELGYTKEDEFCRSMADEIEKRYIENTGWKNRKDEEQVNLFSTFWSLYILSLGLGREAVAQRYRGCIEKILDRGRANQLRWCFFNQQDDSLAATSYALILMSRFYPQDPYLQDVKRNVLALLDEALKNEYVMEMEVIPGTNWYHYSYCWSLKALHGLDEPIDIDTEMITTRVLNYIDGIFLDGRGFKEPERGICNVPSIFNNIFAIDAVKNNPHLGDCPGLAVIFR